MLLVQWAKKSLHTLRNIAGVKETRIEFKAEGDFDDDGGDGDGDGSYYTDDDATDTTGDGDDQGTKKALGAIGIAS